VILLSQAQMEQLLMHGSAPACNCQIFPTRTSVQLIRLHSLLHSYNLGDRRHNFVLIEKNSRINHQHLIIGQLYKYSY